MNQPFEAVRGGLPVNEGLSSFNQLPKGAMSPTYVSPSAMQGAQLPPMTVGSSGSAGMNQFIGEFGGASAGAAPAPNAMAGLPPSQVSPAAAVTPKPPINIAPVTPAPVPTTPLGTPTAPTGMTNAMAEEALKNMTPMERASAMGEGFTGKNLANFANENRIMAAGMVAGPILASQTQNQPGVPTVPVDRDPGQQYDYYPGTALPTPSADPYGREKTYYTGSYRPRTAADGGMMGWPAGESVMRMADGGVPTYGPGDTARFFTDTAAHMLRQMFPHLMGVNSNSPTKKYTYDPQAQNYIESGMSTPSGAPQGYNYDAQNQQFITQVPPTTTMADGGVPRYDMGGIVDALTKASQQDPAYRQLMGLDANAPLKKYIYDQQNQRYLESGMGTPSEAPQGYDYNAQNQQFTAQVPPITPMATGGISDAHYNLGGYSDGGRLLRGPGDGVSDSIPATIGRKQPARLADGEFVVPARIVSELGNGSTEAGARKLYAMMDRVQKARGKTVGKGKVAKNSRADKHLPA
jgi:hypothetical protein